LAASGLDDEPAHSDGKNAIAIAPVAPTAADRTAAIIRQ